MALSFANDIRPLFRDTPDVDTMKQFGMDSVGLPGRQNARRGDILPT